MSIKKFLSTSLALTGLLLAFVLLFGLPKLAGRAEAPAAPAVAPQNVGVDNETCLACHGLPDQQITLPSGEILYLTVDREIYNNSVHGKNGYACVQCHTTLTSYPHPPLAAYTRRDATLNLYQSCGRCHYQHYDRALDSVHQKALATGNRQAAVCTDCHGAHNVRPPNEPRSHIPQTCQLCHSEIYKRYEESVHGSALLGEGNPDVPSCIDCHGVHDVEGPSDSQFHLFSPQICAKCHANDELMAKYGISTDVFETYVADFHGTTVVLFEKTTPDQETNKPVCIDCHGVHDMREVDDPESTVIKENLLQTCQKCHPDATLHFPEAWIAHYQPAPDNHPVVYYVNLFYSIFIPTLLGGMGLFVVTDAGRRLYSRLKERQHG
ncbi:MAG: ammonia-forming cytochrome c nitrite reductase subunit c552 [Anaerolineales bacterium]|nr:MAG: ammonia-forming cytochrome c nitrite reductase subunit c552 [Anaerolineales bacterium]